MSDAMRTTIAGEVLELCPERAVHWRERRTLLIADPHFGKAATFRALGVPTPRGTTGMALRRIDALIARVQPERIVFLGDFLHAKEGRNVDTFDRLAAWRTSHADIAMCIVRGNHDKRAGDPPSSIGIECVDGPLLEPPFALTHHPVPHGDAYVLAGHVHPCAVMIGPARQRERLPCFAFGAHIGILPAFGEFTGCAEIAAKDHHEIWLVTPGETAEVILAPRMRAHL